MRYVGKSPKPDSLRFFQSGSESPRRGENFISKKICRAAAQISNGIIKNVELGDISSRREWGHSKDYVKAMWLSAQVQKPDDYIISTGVMHSVEDILTIAFKRVSLNWQNHVVINKKYFRSSDPSRLYGDCAKARNLLEWVHQYRFIDIIHEMVDYELGNLG